MGGAIRADAHWKTVPGSQLAQLEFDQAMVDSMREAPPDVLTWQEDEAGLQRALQESLRGTAEAFEGEHSTCGSSSGTAVAPTVPKKTQEELDLKRAIQESM